MSESKVVWSYCNGIPPRWLPEKVVRHLVSKCEKQEDKQIKEIKSDLIQNGILSEDGKFTLRSLHQLHQKYIDDDSSCINYPKMKLYTESETKIPKPLFRCVELDIKDGDDSSSRDVLCHQGPIQNSIKRGATCQEDISHLEKHIQLFPCVTQQEAKALNLERRMFYSSDGQLSCQVKQSNDTAWQSWRDYKRKRKEIEKQQKAAES